MYACVWYLFESTMNEDLESLYVNYYVHRPIRNIDIVINCVRNFTDWNLIEILLHITYIYAIDSSLTSLLARDGLDCEINDFGTDLMKSDDSYYCD